MTAITKAHQRVLDLMDVELFTPVLEEAKADDFEPYQRPGFTELQAFLRRERDKIANAGSAEAAVRYYIQLVATTGDDLDQQLGELKLPTATDLKQEVEKLAAELALQWREQRG